MNYSGIIPEDVANGPGVRVSLFISGCSKRCKGCFNRTARDFNAGEKFTYYPKKDSTFSKIIKYVEEPFISGITLLGGDPCNPRNIVDTLEFVTKYKSYLKNHNMKEKDNIWVYTGYLIEKMLNPNIKAFDQEVVIKLLTSIDVLVDGPFIQELKDPTLKFRGSSNQRLIDTKNSIKQNKVIQIEL